VLSDGCAIRKDVAQEEQWLKPGLKIIGIAT